MTRLDLIREEKMDINGRIVQHGALKWDSEKVYEVTFARRPDHIVGKATGIRREADNRITANVELNPECAHRIVSEDWVVSIYATDLETEIVEEYGVKMLKINSATLRGVFLTPKSGIPIKRVEAEK